MSEYEPDDTAPDSNPTRMMGFLVLCWMCSAAFALGYFLHMAWDWLW